MSNRNRLFIEKQFRIDNLQLTINDGLSASRLSFKTASI